MARKPQFTDESVLAAGRRLLAKGATVTKSALRREAGGGNPARLWTIWLAREATPSTPPADTGALAEPLRDRPPAARAAMTKERRKNDPEGTRRDVLDAAIAEFAEKGLTGARVDAIAARTRTTKRSIYYYFGSKDGLYIAVLESVYASIRAVEQTMHLASLEPAEAMRALIEFTFDYHNDHPDFSRLVMIENIHHAQHLKRSPSIRNLNVSVIDDIRTVLHRGRASGVFLRDIDPIDLHMMISSFCFFRMSNRYTFTAIFGGDFSRPDTIRRHKSLVCEMILSFLMRPDRDVGAAALGPALATG